MTTKVTYSYARQNLARLLEEAEDAQEPVIIQRRNREDMALIPAAELSSLEASAHLLRSPKTAQRLLAALRRALDGKVKPSTVEDLKAGVGLP